MLIKRWQLMKNSKEEIAELSESCGISPLLAALLLNRGLRDDEQIESFLGEGDFLDDPFLLTDMDKAVERLEQAVESGERVAIYGDYDADGVTATAMLYRYLRSRDSDVSYYIPDRFAEGYGLNREAIDRLAASGARLIVTVDNGIASLDEAEYIRSLGIDLVVTDHHQLKDRLPAAAAVINPQRDLDSGIFTSLCGAGVAFKLICAMEGDIDGPLERFADLLALGTVADVMPLEGENRFFVRRGIDSLESGANPGLSALLQAADKPGREMSSFTLAFLLAPRVNAAGRMGDAGRAAQLLITDSPAEAQRLAEEIHEDNRLRQEQEGIILQEIEQMLENNSSATDREILVLAGEGWHQGVIGIVAARLCERFHKPCVLFSVTGDEARGSARSVEGFDIYRAIQACGERLLHFGGHKQAAGVTLLSKDLEWFADRVNAYVKELPDVPAPAIKIDMAVNPAKINVEVVDEISLLEPFGEGNPPPLFLIAGNTVQSLTPLSGGKHTRLTLSGKGGSFSAILFGQGPNSLAVSPGSSVDLVVSLSKNVYQGNESVNILVKDLRPSGFDQEGYFNCLQTLKKAEKGEMLGDGEYDLLAVDRQQLAEVYRFIKNSAPAVYDPAELFLRLPEPRVTFGQMMVSLHILKQLELIELKPGRGGTQITVPLQSGKTSLERSPIFQAIVRRQTFTLC